MTNITDIESGMKKRILVVDDDKSIIGIVRMCLESHYMVYDAEDHDEALRVEAAVKPDMILLDIVGVDGELLSSELTTPFVVMTSCDDKDIIRRMMKNGSLGIIPKPIAPSVFLEQVKFKMSLCHDEKIDGFSADVGKAVGYLMCQNNCSSTEAIECLESTGNVDGAAQHLLLMASYLTSLKPDK